MKNVITKNKLRNMAESANAPKKYLDKIEKATTRQQLAKIKKSLVEIQKENNRTQELSDKMNGYVKNASGKKRNVKLSLTEQIKFAKEQNRVNKMIPESAKENRTFFTPVTPKQKLKGMIALEYQEAGEYDRTRKLLKVPKKYSLREGTTLDAVKKLSIYNRYSNKDISHLATSIREAKKTGVKGFDDLFNKGGVELIREFSRNGFTIIEWADSLRESNVPNYKEVIAEKIKSTYVRLQDRNNIEIVKNFLTNLGIKLPKHPLD